MKKVVLITGVSSGFGHAMAAAFTKAGYTVYGTVRRSVEPVPGVNYLQMEVTQPESVRQAVDEIMTREQTLDVVINNAGGGIGGPLEFTPVEEARQLMDVNFFGAVNVIQAVLPVMRRQQNGLLICMSSVGGIMGLPYQGMYSAGKFALEGYCQALRLEIRSCNIKVVIVNPGDFSTHFTSSRKKIEGETCLGAYPGYPVTLALIEQSEQNGLKPEYLAGKMVRIAGKKNPSERYILATPPQKASVYLKRYLPERMFTAILRTYYKT